MLPNTPCRISDRKSTEGRTQKSVRRHCATLTLLEGATQTSQDIGTQAREVSQAMVERVDKVEGQIMTVRSTLKTEAYMAADYQSQQLKTEIMGQLNQILTALETRLTHQMNEDR